MNGIDEALCSFTCILMSYENIHVYANLLIDCTLGQLLEINPRACIDFISELLRLPLALLIFSRLHFLEVRGFLLL